MFANRNKNRLTWTLAVLAVFAATPVFAQVHQVQLGNQMDANPAVGSGGSNRPITGYVPINGNDVISGNVSGLKYFHGSSPITSTYQFQGTLGSSNLANFSRQSAGGAVGSGALSQTYFLPSSTVSTAQGSLYSAPVGSGFDSQLIPRSSVSPVASSSELRAVAPFQEGRAIDRAVPFVNLPTGSPGTLLSSPLFALRQNGPEMESQIKVDQVGKPTTPGEGGPEIPNSTGTFNNPNTPNSPNAGPEGTDNTLASRDPRLNAPAESTAAKNDQRIGSAYASLLDQISSVEASTNIDPRSTLLASSSGGRTGNGATDIDPLTGRPRQIMQVPVKNQNYRPGVPDQGIGGGVAGGAAGTPNGAVLPGQTINGAGGLRPSGAIPQPSASAGLSPKRLQDLPTDLLTAGGRVKPVKTLVPETTGAIPVSPFDGMMARGEAMLKDGRYLESGVAFQSALAARPDDALALIGWAHADLGAGFYASAANNLKFAYTHKPELVSVKFDPGNFIPASRVDYLVNDLQKLTTSPQQGNLASFLYCYLCYQSGRGAELRAELKKWGARENHDEWQPVVERAWTGAGPATQPSAAK